MDLKRLRTFVVVADLGTVSKAALRLRISQSALSRQISDLEYEFGFKLFDRIGRRLASSCSAIAAECLVSWDRSASASSYSNVGTPAY
jgi:Bacterial regulatory helix-turn-helix protein, lysR family